MHRIAVKALGPGGAKIKTRYLPSVRRAPEIMMVLPPKLTVGSAILVAMPRIEIGNAARRIRSVDRYLDVGDVVACGGEKACQPTLDHRADLVQAGHRWNIWAVVDDRIGGKKRQDIFRFSPVEVIAVSMDHVGDGRFVEQALQALCVIHWVLIATRIGGCRLRQHQV